MFFAFLIKFMIEIKTSDIPDFTETSGLRLIFEASTRYAMTHDYPDDKTSEKVDLNYMLGYRSDPGANRNSFPQTDENKHPGTLELYTDDIKIADIFLPDCPADSRGVLSHHYQPVDNLLDEAGSYGILCDIRFPSRLIPKLAGQKSFKLAYRMKDTTGLSLYGRRSGRYGIGIILKTE
jgi:hypothetical protein